MNDDEVRSEINDSWARRAEITPQTGGRTAAAVAEVLDRLDAGELRVADKAAGGWVVHEWVKMAVLLSFRLKDLRLVPGSSGGLSGARLRSC